MNNSHGQIFILALVILSLITISTVSIIAGALTFSQNAKYSTEVIQATNLAEAGIDKAVASLNKNPGAYNGEGNTTTQGIPLGPGEYSVSVTPISSSVKLISSTGYIPNKTNPKTKKTITIQISKGAGISFVYGMLIGNGGISMGNGSTINGSIYANGDIIGGNNETITGDAWVAGGTQAVADQSNECTDNCGDFIFGKNTIGNDQLDVAQSFIPTCPPSNPTCTSAVINKVSLKLKKSNSSNNFPSLTVRLLADLANKPDKSNIIASGTLNANLVTTNYGFVDVTFNSSPSLNMNTTYWIVIDTTSDSSNFWYWQSDTLAGYTRGIPLWSPDWQAKNPSWNTPSPNIDLVFKTYMGGVITSISMNNGSRVNQNVRANTINGIIIGKDAYYQTITNSTVNGTSHPNSPDPDPIGMPISSGNILEWQQEAEGSGPPSGDITNCPSTFGPGKIDGSVTIGNNCTVTIKTPIWVTHDLSMGNSSVLKMDPNLGSTSGVIIVDGITTFTNGNDLLGTGQSGSYLTLLSTQNTELTGLTAINTGNSSITGILYAPFGLVSLANNANFKEVVAWKISMGTGTILTYDTGLISTFFSTGPTGSFNAIKGSYQIK